MLIEKEGGGHVGGPYDVIGIMEDASTGRFHCCFWEEHQLPGPFVEVPEVVRLKSRMHHTVGAETFEGAVAHAVELSAKISLDPRNLWLRREQVVARHFAGEGPAGVMVVANWRRDLLPGGGRG